ncbi:MAG: ATP-binding protein [Candidatus Magasanikbacteria bacterium]|nr:ATP-binding protein [Candidatus Magasanikbacteria bacterium]
MYIKRKIEDEILKYLKRPEIIALIGPRQCGKTTTIKRIFGDLKNDVFLTFEDQEVLNLFENNIKAFISTYIAGKDYVFIDEFQYAKNGGKLLKYVYDTHHTKIIISGSSALDLTLKAAKYLVGRVFVLEIFPFDFGEYLLSRDRAYYTFYEKNKIDLKRISVPLITKKQRETLNKYFEEYLIWGGYPAVVLSKTEEEKRAVLKNIYNTYFLRDVKDILGLVDDYKLGKLIRALALQIGNMIEYKELTEISEFSYHTLKKYLNFLNKTYITGFSRPFYKNKRKEIVKNQKVYFFDTGLRNHMVNNFQTLHKRDDQDKGFLLKNGCYTQFVKNNFLPQYWRDKNQNEVDFILDIGEGNHVAMEVKLNQNKCRISRVFKENYKDFSVFCIYFYATTEDQDASLFIPLL